jgi:hypothetical protein
LSDLCEVLYQESAIIFAWSVSFWYINS